MSFVCFSQPSRWYHFATATWCGCFWKKLPIFHASKLESPTSVSHGIQRSKFTFNPQLASAKNFLPDWASALKALTRRMPLRVMAFLEAKKPQKQWSWWITTLHTISGKIPQNYYTFASSLIQPKIGNLITPAKCEIGFWISRNDLFKIPKSSFEAASAIKPSLLVTTSIQKSSPWVNMGKFFEKNNSLA